MRLHTLVLVALGVLASLVLWQSSQSLPPRDELHRLQQRARPPDVTSDVQVPSPRKTEVDAPAEPVPDAVESAKPEAVEAAKQRWREKRRQKAAAAGHATPPTLELTARRNWGKADAPLASDTGAEEPATDNANAHSGSSGAPAEGVDLPLFYSHLRQVAEAQRAYSGAETNFRKVDKSKKRYCDVRYRGGPLVVTMTTVPPRIEAINHTLHKIYDQTLAPDEVILAVPSMSRRFNVPYVLPPKLQDFVDSGKLTLLQGATDYGPATKLIPTLLELRRRKLKDAAIVVIDDDTYYSSHLLCEYVKASTRHPGAALGFRGFNFSERRRAELCAYRDVPEGVALVQNGGASHAADDPIDVLTVTGSLMVPLRQLDSLVVDGYRGCAPAGWRKKREDLQL